MALKGGHCSEKSEKERETERERGCLLWKYEEVTLQEFHDSTGQGSPHAEDLKGVRVSPETREKVNSSADTTRMIDFCQHTECCVV